MFLENIGSGKTMKVKEVGRIYDSSVYVEKKSGEKIELTKRFINSRNEEAVQFRYLDGRILHRLPLTDFYEIFETEQEYKNNKDVRKICKLENELNNLKKYVKDLEGRISEVINI